MRNLTEYFSYKQAMNYLGFNSYKTLKQLVTAGLPIIQVGKTKKLARVQ